MNLNLANLATAVQNLGQSARNFEAFLKDIFQMDGIFEAELLSINAINDERLGDFDFKNTQIYAKDLQKGEGLGFVLVPTKTHKKRDLVLATRAINRAHAAHMIVFFISSNSSKNSAQNSSLPSLRGENFAENSAENSPKLSIAFATRRFHKNRKIDTDVIDKITLIKDIDIFRPSHAHLLNLHAIATIAPSAVNAYYQAILEALSVSALNIEFYKKIKAVFDSILSQSTIDLNEQSRKEFAIKLIGRVLFVRFLRELKIIPSEIFPPKIPANYYECILAPLFFDVLNTPMNARNADIKANTLFTHIPYLNGGLFSVGEIDCYEQGEFGSFSSAKVPDSVFSAFYEVLDNYHFTIDEQSSDVEEVALDPELLGQIFENLLAEIDPNIDDKDNIRKATGSFYTPRNIVASMCQNALLQSLKSKLNLPNLDALVLRHDSSTFSDTQKQEILNTLNSLKILDLFCGSGAFPMGILHEISEICEVLNDTRSLYKRKLDIIQRQIYGIDIQPIAMEISRLRCFLSLIIESHFDSSKENSNIAPLPNLEFKFIAANSLLKLQDTITVSAYKDKLKTIHAKTFEPHQNKASLKQEFKKLWDSIYDDNKDDLLLSFQPFSDTTSANFFDADFMFGVSGFDICISNPPYISTKGKAHQANKDKLLEQDGFFDDSYNHAFFACMRNLADNGVLSLITPKTFWTINTKKNLREFILKHRLDSLTDSANPFYSAMVDTCITQISKCDISNDQALFIDAAQDFAKPIIYKFPQSLYKEAQVFFKPTSTNLSIFEKYNKTIKSLMSRWWSKIDTSKNIAKNANIISSYRKTLKAGDITILGLIADGGQGLATANNGKFIAVIDTSKEALKVREARAEKLYKAKKVWQDLNLNFTDKKSAQEFLNAKSESEIHEIFDKAKAKFGRDIFGQGFIYRIISQSDLANLSTLSQDEKLNGINSPRCFVPYDKGDKDGNRWYLPTPYFIEWSVESVKSLQNDPKARWQGYNFYFKEGFCWNLILDPKSTQIKCRLRDGGIPDVGCHSLNALTLTNKFLVCIINSTFACAYVKDFINSTVNFTTNDCKQIPIIIPSPEQLAKFEAIFDECYQIQQEKFTAFKNANFLGGKDEIRSIENKSKIRLTPLQNKLDKMVYELYGMADLSEAINLAKSNENDESTES